MKKGNLLKSKKPIMLLLLLVMSCALMACGSNEAEATNGNSEVVASEENTKTTEVIDVEGTVWKCYKTTVDGEETTELQDTYGGKYYYMFEADGVVNSMMLGNIADNPGTYTQDGEKVSIYQNGDVELTFVGDELQFTFWGILFHFELSSTEAMEAELNQ